jgi:hypothetical protein
MDWYHNIQDWYVTMGNTVGYSDGMWYIYGIVVDIFEVFVCLFGLIWC